MNGSPYGVPLPRLAIVAAVAGTVVAGWGGATEPESASPSRMSAVATAPDGAGLA